MATDTVALVKERLSIADVVSPYVKLKRAGRSLTGLCPFHKEKTPSFHVSLERGTWHCFGCGLGGDAFSFIEKIEGVDFKGALKMLADKAGVPLVYSSTGHKEESEKRERLYTLLETACEWYVSALPETAARRYALARALTEESIKAWRLGFARDEWRALLEALTAKGYTTQELLAAGLIKEADGKPGTYYDRFRNRLIFPISDSAGRVVAFTGRALSADEQAKYLNSPETELYHKSSILFGLHKAKEAIRSRGFTLLMEGQMDVLHAHQADFTNAVALSGTALTEEHLRLLKRSSENLMLVLDGDSAGLSATAKSAALALSSGMRVKAVRLPSGQDPADVLSENPGEFKKRVTEAKPIVDFFLTELAERERDPHQLLRKVEAVVLPLLRAIASPMEREHFLASTARTLGLSSESVRESLGRVAPVAVETHKPPTPTRESPVELRRRQLTALVHAYVGTDLADRVKTEYSRITEASLDGAAPTERELFEIEELVGESPGTHAADELLHAFEKAVIREAYAVAVADLRRAESSGDAIRVKQEEERAAMLAKRLAALD